MKRPQGGMRPGSGSGAPYGTTMAALLVAVAALAGCAEAPDSKAPPGPMDHRTDPPQDERPEGTVVGQEVLDFTITAGLGFREVNSFYVTPEGNPGIAMDPGNATSLTVTVEWHCLDACALNADVYAPDDSLHARGQGSSPLQIDVEELTEPGAWQVSIYPQGVAINARGTITMQSFAP